MKNRTVMMALAILLIFSLGCSITNRIRSLVSSDDPTPVVELPTATNTPTSEPEEDVETVAEPTATPTAETQAGASDGDSMGDSEVVDFSGAANLDLLDSYRLLFAIDFDGTSGGQPSAGSIEVFLESSKSPDAMHLSMSMAGDTVEQVGGFNSLEVYDVNDTIYMYNEAMGDQWISIPSTDDEAFTEGFFSPDEDLELPKTAVCDAQPEDINGVLAKHCSFTEADVSGEQATYDSLSGDVWVAEDGGYIVRYELQAEGYQSLNPGEGDFFDFGSVSFFYELSDVNIPFDISPPDEALNAGGLFGVGGSDDSGGDDAGADADLPILDDAEELFSVAGITTYYTGSSVEEAVAFYQQELALLGWVEDPDSAFVDESTGILSFTNDNSTLIATFNLENDGRVNVGLVTTEE